MNHAHGMTVTTDLLILAAVWALVIGFYIFAACVHLGRYWHDRRAARRRAVMSVAVVRGLGADLLANDAVLSREAQR